MFKYSVAFLVSAAFAAVATPLVARFARHNRIYRDARNDEYERHIHSQDVPRLGGAALFISFWSALIIFAGTNRLILGILIGSAVVFFAGVYDDLKELSALKKLLFQVIAALIVVASGLSINEINSPLGGVIALDVIKIPVLIVDGHTYNFVPIADILTVLWIVGIINAVNFIDGIDGLAAGITVIAALVLFGLGLSSGGWVSIAIPLSIVLAGVSFGFLPFNFYPARVFLGDSGSMFLGYTVGVISVLSRAKIATTLLVLGVPILDLAWVAIRRVLSGKSPFKPDKGHIHHRLLDAGLTQRQAALLLYFVCGAFGLASFFLKGSYEELIALLLLFSLVMSLSIALMVVISRRQQLSQSSGTGASSDKSKGLTKPEELDHERHRA